MDEQIWQIISAKLNNEIISDKDEHVLEQWLNSSSDNLMIYTRFNNFVKSQRACLDIDTNEAYRKVSQRISKNKSKNIFRKAVVATSVAASILFAIFILPKKENGVIELAYSNDISITDSSSIQLLYKDKVITLNDSKDTSFVNLPNLHAYTVGRKLFIRENNNIETNHLFTLYVPFGKDYKVSFSDGSDIMLNSNSILTFPASFNSAERNVKLLGEACFNVDKSVDWPFIVETEDINVMVTGTFFNVKAYRDEVDVTTTLIKGAVTVIPREKPYMEVDLLPCEQYSLNTLTGKQIVREVDPNLSLAWTNSLFVYKNNNLKDIMRDLKRWYNIRYEFEDQESGNIKLSANIERGKNVDTIINMIEKINKVDIEKRGCCYYIKAKSKH